MDADHDHEHEHEHESESEDHARQAPLQISRPSAHATAPAIPRSPRPVGCLRSKRPEPGKPC